MPNITEILIPIADFTLSGTLVLPQVDQSEPVVLLLPGSGPVDRDENCSKLSTNILSQIADCLAEINIASFRFDKRGVGKSGGDYLSCGYIDCIYDAKAVLEHLRSLEQLADRKFILLGHSAGGAFAAQIASQDESIAGVILLSAPITSGETVLTWQCKQILKAMPFFLKYLLKLFRINLIRKQQFNFQRLKQTTTDVARIGLKKINAKWFREMLAFDISKISHNIHCPILAITGEKDIQVNPEDLKLLKTTAPYEYHIPENITHLLRSDPHTPTVKNYRQQVKHPVDVKIKQIIIKWLGKLKDP